MHTGGCLRLGSTETGRPDALFRLASLSKPFAGALAFAFVEDGLLDLDEPVARWSPELAEPRVPARRGGPLAEEISARQPEPGALAPPICADESMARLGELPLAASLSAGQRAEISSSVGPGRSWGMQVGAQVAPGQLWATPGRWGWDGRTGTTGWVDPERDLVAVLLTTRG